jgi:error-prone DNA polymerase
MIENTPEQTHIDTWHTLSPHIKRPIPNSAKYLDRLAEEIELISNQNFAPHFLRVLEILELTKDLPHITRGSAGSSLVCYVLGITDVDPVAHGIPLARFINPLRDDLPDVDVDYPQPYHKEVLNRIYAHWPGRAARLSNYVKYQKKSAEKEALKRVCGIKGQAVKNRRPSELVPAHQKLEWKKLTDRLIGKKKSISKHPGGVVVFEQPPAQSLIIKRDNQILLDKHEVEDLALLKVDVLSNRGLSVIWDCSQQGPFDYAPGCDLTMETLSRGNSIGIVQGESPVMRRTLKSLQPTCLDDLTLATALIRPAALTGRQKGVFFRDWIGHNRQPSKLKHTGGLVFDEDAISLICEVLECGPYEADMYRRGFVKRNEEMMFEFLEKIGENPRKNEVLELLTHMDGFGLCKAHAVNLAQLIYAQAWEKTHNPQRFWLAALQNSCSMYRPWVHIEAAKRAGWRIEGSKRPWLVDGHTLYNKDWTVPLFDSHWSQLAAGGFWTHPDWLPGTWFQQMGNMSSFCGLIAAHRSYHKGQGDYVTFATLGTASGEFLEVVLPGLVSLRGEAFVEGMGRVDVRNGNTSVVAASFKTLSASDHQATYG